MPDSIYDTNSDSYVDADVSLAIVLTMTLVFLCSELIFLFRQGSYGAVKVVSIVAHVLACTLMLKFAIDLHPVAHFWWMLIFTSCPQLLLQFGICVFSIRDKWKYCWDQNIKSLILDSRLWQWIERAIYYITADPRNQAEPKMDQNLNDNVKMLWRHTISFVQKVCGLTMAWF